MQNIVRVLKLLFSQLLCNLIIRILFPYNRYVLNKLQVSEIDEGKLQSVPTGRRHLHAPFAVPRHSLWGLVLHHMSQKAATLNNRRRSVRPSVRPSVHPPCICSSTPCSVGPSGVESQVQHAHTTSQNIQKNAKILKQCRRRI